MSGGVMAAGGEDVPSNMLLKVRVQVVRNITKQQGHYKLLESCHLGIRVSYSLDLL